MSISFNAANGEKSLKEVVELAFDYLDSNELISYTRTFRRNELVPAMYNKRFKTWEVLGYKDHNALNAYFRTYLKIENTSTWEASILGLVGYTKCPRCSTLSQESECARCDRSFRDKEFITESEDALELIFDYLEANDLIKYTKGFSRSQLVYALASKYFKAWEVLGHANRQSLSAYFRKNLKLENTSTWEASILAVLDYSKCPRCRVITKGAECTSCETKLKGFKY